MNTLALDRRYEHDDYIYITPRHLLPVFPKFLAMNLIRYVASIDFVRDVNALSPLIGKHRLENQTYNGACYTKWDVVLDRSIHAHTTLQTIHTKGSLHEAPVRSPIVLSRRFPLPPFLCFVPSRVTLLVLRQCCYVG